MTSALQSSESNEWYTPQQYIDLVHEMFEGPPDLDPASSEMANIYMQAKDYYCKETNAFDRLPWEFDTLFCNPPYGGMQGKFLDYCMDQTAQFDYRQMIFLCNASIGEKWFLPAWSCHAICFVSKRIKFDCPVYYHECSTEDRVRFWDATGLDTNIPIRGEGPQPTKGNAFIYVGGDRERFARIFQHIGNVVICRPGTRLHHAA